MIFRQWITLVCFLFVSVYGYAATTRIYAENVFSAAYASAHTPTTPPTILLARIQQPTQKLTTIPANPSPGEPANTPTNKGIPPQTALLAIAPALSKKRTRTPGKTEPAATAAFNYDAPAVSLQIASLPHRSAARISSDTTCTSTYDYTRLNIQFYGFRYYDPQTGRWPNRDPIEERGGVNLYGFVSNMTLYAVDVLGLNASSFLSPNALLRGYEQQEHEIGFETRSFIAEDGCGDCKLRFALEDIRYLHRQSPGGHRTFAAGYVRIRMDLVGGSSCDFCEELKIVQVGRWFEVNSGDGNNNHISRAPDGVMRQRAGMQNRLPRNFSEASRQNLGWFVDTYRSVRDASSPFWDETPLGRPSDRNNGLHNALAHDPPDIPLNVQSRNHGKEYYTCGVAVSRESGRMTYRIIGCLHWGIMLSEHLEFSFLMPQATCQTPAPVISALSRWNDLYGSRSGYETPDIQH